MHFTRKLLRVARMTGCLFMAQMFGQYRHSAWNGEINYAEYEWRGAVWQIPTSPVEDRP
jgi:hypothetical protein